MAATTTLQPLVSYSGSGGTPSDLFVRPVKLREWKRKNARADAPFYKLIDTIGPPEQPALKAEWGYGSPAPIYDQLNGSINSSTTSVTVDDASKFQVGATFQIESEVFLTTAVNETDNIVTVATRPYGGSAASHADNLTIQIMLPAIMEHQATPLSPEVQGELLYNYHQQAEFSLQLSHRRRVIDTYETFNGGLRNDERARLQRKLEWDIPRYFEHSLLFGTRSLGSASSPSSFGGIFSTTDFTTTRNTSISGALTEATLMENLQTVYNLVGNDDMGKVLMAHPFVLRAISSWYSSTRRSTMNDTKVRLQFTEIDTGWFGTLRMVPNYMMVKSGTNANAVLDRLIVFNPDDFKIQPLSSDSTWHIDPLPEEGWFDRAAIRGDYTLLAGNPDNRLILGGFSVTAADYPGLSA